MSEAKSLAAFTRSAVDFDVAESDFLVLLDSKISTFESMAYRLPVSADLEEYLRKTLRTRGAYRDSDGAIIMYNKRKVDAWEDYKTGEDAGCIRKLWGFALQVAKKELEALATPGEESRHKVSLTTSHEWETRATEEGMPIPLSDKERPSLHCLTKVQAAYSTGGTFEYLNWEVFVDAEHEGRLRRQGKLTQDRQEVILEGSKLGTKKKPEVLETNMKIEDAMDVREVLEIRARAFHMAKVCDFETCRKITERYLSKLRATQVVGMRGPTINEIRRADREIFHEILNKAAKGSGSVQSGLEFFLGSPEHHLWKLLDPQIESMPDQGVEPKVKSEKRKREASPAKEKPDRHDSPPASKARMCIVCGKRHEPRCDIPAGFRREERAKQKAVKERRQSKKGDGRKGGGSKGDKPEA